MVFKRLHIGQRYYFPDILWETVMIVDSKGPWIRDHFVKIRKTVLKKLSGMNYDVILSCVRVSTTITWIR